MVSPSTLDYMGIFLFNVDLYRCIVCIGLFAVRSSWVRRKFICLTLMICPSIYSCSVLEFARCKV